MVSSPESPIFVWIDAEGQGRYLRAYFRQSVTLTALPRSARLNLFADGRYQVRVNGTLIGNGPVRFYPEHPEYDGYDLLPWLTTGENVIAVEVLHTGIATFHTVLMRAGFAAWGDIVHADGQAQSLATPGAWLCREATGYDRTTPKFSFATGPIQIFDERKAVPGWYGPLTSTEGWRTPVALRDNSGYGAFEPRSIPQLTQKLVSPQRLLSAHRHVDDEIIYSFRAWDFAAPGKHVAPQKLIFAYTYIYSAKAQKVQAAAYWGEHYLNGVLLKKGAETRLAAQDTVLKLNAGWNFLFISYGMWTSTWDFHLALPKNVGLVLSPSKKLDDREIFKVSLTIEKDDAFVKGLEPEKLTEPPAVPGGWSVREMPTAPVLPAKAMAWAKFGPPLPLRGEDVRNLSVPAGQPTSFIFDMGGEVLGRIFVDFEAPEGTIIDVGYAEELKDGRPWHYKNVQVHAGERHIAAGGESRLETFYPRGFRYLQVMVSGHTAPVALHELGVVSQIYPHKRRGWFRCSDPLFDQIWEAGWRTLLVCSEDVYTDCPWRERTLYAGDLLAEIATAMVTSGDTALAKRSMRLFIQSQSKETNWQQSMAPMERTRDSLFDYPLLNLVACEWFGRLTPDPAFIKEAYATYRILMQCCLEQRNANGLYSSFSQPFIDHTGIVKKGFSCPLNALVARSWHVFAALAESQGHKEEAAEAHRHGEAAAKAVRDHFWDAQAGAFVDCLVDGHPEGDHAPAASYWCVFFGVTTPEQDHDIVRHFEQRWALLEHEVEHFGTPYGAFYLIGALYKIGTPEAVAFAERFIRRQWGLMIYHGTDTIWEHFHTANSLAHAWSTAPNYYCSTRILGVHLGLPDTANPRGPLLIAPESETLTWAEGALPHEKGMIEVSWKIRGTHLDVTVRVPDGVAYTVVPRGRLAQYELCLNAE
ncbi:MAG: family 78 glycoside hydrolase catalytic domain [Verrucomicrobiota bacterium]|nr:family 78 glycoside hydrolase catalytic domain [Verrucomicrobiota bacterium]